MPIAISGTKRHEAEYVHSTIRGATSMNERISWWLRGRFEQWRTIYIS